jgi:signal transduction histidine kinase
VVLEEQERLSGLVDDMLLLARIDEGQPSVGTEIDLDDIVFAETSRSNPAVIDVIGVGPVRVRGDERQLTRLARNLVDNAVRHARQQIVVTLVAEDGCALLVVEDDGPGVPEGDRDRVFERFFRLEDARSRDEGGAGLGLALVAGVAAAHGGSVAVTGSSLGGARFEVQLPVVAGE